MSFPRGALPVRLSSVIFTLAALLFLHAPAWSVTTAPQGFGASTSGGSGRTVVHVTNLADSGTGSLRAALSAGSRYVVFDVAGTIQLQSPLYVRGAYVTIDGSSAPTPGITLRQAGLVLDGAAVHDVVVRGIRIREPGIKSALGDGITIKNDVANVLIDRVSIDGCTDGNLDITRRSHDITVQWSVLTNCAKNMLVDTEARRLSIHHNAFVDGQWRNPNISHSDEFVANAAPETTADVRNNLVWGWGDSGGGTILQCGAKVNVVGNFYSSPGTAPLRQANAIVDDGCIIGSPAQIHASGNVSADDLAFDVNRVSDQVSPFSAPPLDASPACIAAHDVLAGAGAEPLDAVDLEQLSAIRLPTCAAAPPPTVTLSATPAVVTAGASATLTWSVTNATACSASGGWSGPKTASGSEVLWPTNTASYTLSCTGSGGSGSGTATVTVDATPPPFAKLVQTEDATLTLPMVKGSDASALGGAYVAPASGVASTIPSASATLAVTVPSAGTHYLWARLKGPTADADALYVGIDSSWDRIFPAAIGAYEWVRVENGMNSGTFGFPLAAGTHVLKAAHGEIGARLDALYLTTNAAEVPTASPPPVPAPTLTLSASPSSIRARQATVLTWSASGATSCLASGGWTGTKPTAGTWSGKPRVTTTYGLTCSGPGGSVSKSVTVSVSR